MSALIASALTIPCSSQATTVVTPTATPPPVGGSLVQNFYDFTGGSDGAFPRGSLLYVRGRLWGSTSSGGGTACSCAGGGPSPETKLYGTAQSGGLFRAGILFTVNRDGGLNQYTSLERADGVQPGSGITLGAGRALYGSAHYGGANDKGTLYKFCCDLP